MTGRARRRPSLAARLATITLGLGIAAGLASPPPAASAQAPDGEDPATGGAGPLELVSQTMLVPADGTYVADLGVGTIDLSDVEVVVTIYRILDTADELDLEPTETLNRVVLGPASEIDTDPGEGLTVRMPIRDGEPIDDLARIRLPDAGVYPIIIELRDSTGPVGSIRTNLIRLPDEAEATEPGAVAILLDLTTGSGLTVAEAIELLEQHPTVPMTAVLPADLVTRLESEPSLAESLAAAVGGRPVLAMTGPVLDVSALAEIDQADLYREAAGATSDALTRLGLRQPPATSTTGAPVTPLGGAWLQGEDVRTVVDLSGHGPGSGLLTTPAGQLAIVAPTDDLTGTAPPEAGGVGWIHQLLAQLTLRRQVGADTSLLRLGGDDHASLASLLDVLGEPGPLRPVPLGDAVPALAAGELEAQGQPLQDLGPIADSLVEVRARLATYESFYVDGADSPARYRALIRQSLGVGTDPSEQASAIDEIDREVLAALDVVSLPQNQSVTLAARSVPIPLTITNAATGTREVLLQFRSDKLMVAEDGHVIRIGPGTSSIDIQVDARSLGVSPLEVRVLTPDGERMLASTRFQVRSTAVPGLGLLLSAIGLVLLGMWWWVSIRRRRSEQPPGSGDGDQASDQDEHRPSGHDAKDGDHRREHDRGSTLLGGSV